MTVCHKRIGEMKLTTVSRGDLSRALKTIGVELPAGKRVEISRFGTPSTFQIMTDDEKDVIGFTYADDGTGGAQDAAGQPSDRDAAEPA